MIAQIVREIVDLGNYTLMRVMRQLDGACRLLNMDGCPDSLVVVDLGKDPSVFEDLGVVFS